MNIEQQVNNQNQMNIKQQINNQDKCLGATIPSPWVKRFSSLIRMGGQVLDLACGEGRHTSFLLENGYKVTAVDKDTTVISDRFSTANNLKILTSDLENGVDPFSTSGILKGRFFDGIVIVNYLYRPIMRGLLKAIRPNGVLIYETFARGNERFGRPRNPDHLLRSGELLELVDQNFQTVAYEHGQVLIDGHRRVKQSLVATNDIVMNDQVECEPPVHCLF